MEHLKPLDVRSIFGILLPGAILIFVAGYVLFVALLMLKLDKWVEDLLGQQLLLTVVLFVAAYLVGSLLRLVAADEVDAKSGKRLLERWKRKNPDLDISRFNDLRKVLARGEDVTDVPNGFDGWLFRVDGFPYSAWQNRKWQVHGPGKTLRFFRKYYRDSMWPQGKASPKDFFNFCKLAVIGGGSPLADEVRAAEGLTRFFAGTEAALRLSIWRLLIPFAVIQLLYVVGLIFFRGWVQRLGLSTETSVHVFCAVFTLALVGIAAWVCLRIVGRFRGVRSKEAMIVYHAFYLDAQAKESRKGKKGEGD